MMNLSLQNHLLSTCSVMVKAHELALPFAVTYRAALLWLQFESSIRVRLHPGVI